MPIVEDQAIREIIESPDTFYYTEQEIPRVYQYDSSVQSAWYNISASKPGSNDGSKPLEYYGNGNREFPWGDPAGTQWTDNLYKQRFVWLPKQPNGKRWPIVWWPRVENRPDSFERETFYSWIYPKGAVLGEALFLSDRHGRFRCFELRIRIRELKGWNVDVYRPFPTEKDFEAALVEVSESSAKKLRDKMGKQDLVYTLRSMHPRRVSFEGKAGIVKLPEIQDKEVDLLFNRPFKSCVGKKWNEYASTPSTDAEYHIVPKNYGMSFINTDSESCMKCHESTNVYVTEFTEGAQRDWYGRIRGSDGIFSLHPFSNASDDGFRRGFQFNQELIRQGIFAPNDPRLHPRSIYQVIPGLK